MPLIWMFADAAIEDGTFSFKHYQSIFQQPREIGLFTNSIVIAFGTTFVCLLIGLPLAFALERIDFPLRGIFAYLYLFPLIIPSYINAIAWINLSPFNLYSIAGAIFVMSLSYFPFVTLLARSGLRSMDRTLEEAAGLYRSRASVLSRITFPLCLPHIVTGAIFVFIFTLANYGVPSLLQVQTYPVEIFAQFSAFYNPKSATALSLPLTLITLILIVLSWFYMKDRAFITISSSARTSRQTKTRLVRNLAFIFCILIILISVGFPVISLLRASGSLLSYKIALLTSYREIANSFFLALVAASLMLVLAFFVAYIVERAKTKTRYLLDAATILPFAVPATVLGVGLIKIWNHPGTNFIYSSTAILILAYVARFSPFAIRAITSNIKQVQPSLEEAALLSSAKWGRRLGRIILPLLKPGLLAAWIICFVFCLGELGTTLLVIPPGGSTLGLKIYSLMHYGANKLVAALSLILIVIALLPILCLIGYRKRQKNE